MIPYKVLARSDASEMFDSISSLPEYRAVDEHPFYGAFGRSYYPKVNKPTDPDVSFVVAEGDAPLLYVPAVINDGVLNYNGMPLRFFFRDGLQISGREAAVRAAFGYIDDLIVKHALTHVRIADDAGASLSAIGEACLGRQYAVTIQLNGMCDLAEDEAGLRRHLRKSFRSLINWGRANLSLAYINQANPDRVAFESYQAFHHHVSGRKTREQKSWDAMFSWLAGGGGELALGYLDGELVAGNLIVDGLTTSYYASGVYDRERFDKPLAHWPLWNALNRSRERGMRWFDLGYVHLQGTVGQKEYAIGYFKRGFATQVASSLEWYWKSMQQD